MPEEVKVPTSTEIQVHHDKRWAELPEEIKIKAMAAVRVVLDLENVERIKELYTENPAIWWGPYHFTSGMWLRNKIRNLTGVTDDQLPSGNWDDYYVSAVEAAFGLREIL